MTASSKQNQLTKSFQNSAVEKTKTQKRIPPVSIRFNETQRRELEKRAKGQALGPYIRDYVLNGHGIERKTRNRNPIKDHEALARVLSALGRSELYNNINEALTLLAASQTQCDGKIENCLLDACADISAMRHSLILALGLQDKGGPS